MDPDLCLLRLAETVRIDLAGSLGIPGPAIGSVESWVEEVRKFGLLEFLEDDQEDCHLNGISGSCRKADESHEWQVFPGLYGISQHTNTPTPPIQMRTRIA